MSIFYKLGRLTYKTQRTVADSASNPIKEFTQGYSETKANEADLEKKLAEKAEELGVGKIGKQPDFDSPESYGYPTNKTPKQAEFDFDV